MGTGLDSFAQEYNDRFFDVGIAEEYAATFAAGLATAGMRPYFAVYSSFLQRAYDQIIHDTAIAGLPVCYLVDRAGVVGDDGETHQGLFDVAFLTTVPGITVYSPAGYRELEGCLEASVNYNSPLVIRYPRGKEKFSFEYNSADFSVFENGGRNAIVSYGIISANGLEASEELKKKGISSDFIKLNKIYPISKELCEKLKGYDKIYFFEEGMQSGGISEHIVAKAGLQNFSITAVDDKFIPPMSIDAAHKKLGLDSESIVKLISGDN
jgi:1-deoxy-D-xylulose-5-phosphate synthase